MFWELIRVIGMLFAGALVAGVVLAIAVSILILIDNDER